MGNLQWDDESKNENAALTNPNPPQAPVRVKVDDKRIINCRADINQLMPIKYNWAWEKYLAGCANHWMPSEINMQRDIEQWRDPQALTAEERHMLKRNFGFLPPPNLWRRTIFCSAPTA